MFSFIKNLKLSIEIKGIHLVAISLIGGISLICVKGNTEISAIAIPVLLFIGIFALLFSLMSGD